MLNSDNLLLKLDQFNTAVYLKDMHGRYLSMNKTGSNFVNQAHKTILGKTSHDLFDLESATKMVESDYHTIRSGSIFTSTFNSIDRWTGAPLKIYTAKSSILSPRGHPLGIIGLSLVNYSDSDLLAQARSLLPHFIKIKKKALLSELLETRTVSDFFKTHFMQ